MTHFRSMRAVHVAAIVAVLSFPLTSGAATLSQAQIDSIVTLLQSFDADPSVITSVRASLEGKAVSATNSGSVTTGNTASRPAIGTISRTLTKGETHTEVKTMQRILNTDSHTRIAETGVGAPGYENSFFGPGTLRALKKFQEKHGLSGPGEEGYGVVGPRTRAKLNEIGARH